jgi:hypothetical protein
MTLWLTTSFQGLLSLHSSELLFARPQGSAVVETTMLKARSSSSLSVLRQLRATFFNSLRKRTIRAKLERRGALGPMTLGALEDGRQYQRVHVFRERADELLNVITFEEQHRTG